MHSLSFSYSVMWTVFCLFICLVIAHTTVGESDLESWKSNRQAVHHDDHHDFGRPASLGDDWDRLFKFWLPNGDEDYQIFIDLNPHHHERPSCTQEDLSHISINDQTLRLSTLESTDSKTYQLFGTIPVQDRETNDISWLNYLVGIKCYAAKHKDESDGVQLVARHPSWDATTPVFGLESFLILDIDGKPWTGQDFVVATHLVNGHSVITHISSPSSSGFIPPDSDSVGGGEVDDDESDINAAEAELQELSNLKHLLKASPLVAVDSDDLNHSLETTSHHQLIESLKSCGIQDISCILETLLRGGKDCFALMVTNFKDYAFGTDPDPCYGMSKGQAFEQAKVLADGPTECSFNSKTNKPSALGEGEYLALPAHDDSDSDSESLYPGQSELESNPEGSADTNKIHAAIGIVASLLCLTCIVQLVHQRCCTPRARAERASRREERRVRRQYRRAARRQALKGWWQRVQERLRKQDSHDSNRSSDYEEKRALIIQQEEVLEKAMQDEIQKLRCQACRTRGGAVDDVLAMVEEGRGGSPSRTSSPVSSTSRRDSPHRPPSLAETLPPYRSRASSGRPPSYNEVDLHATESILDTATNASINEDTLSTLASNDSDETRSLRSLRSIRSCRKSPASSVISLSPRNSSDTLRTERSGI